MPNAVSDVVRPDDPGCLSFVGEYPSIPMGVASYFSLSELEDSEPIVPVFGILLAQAINCRKTGTKPNDKSLYSRVSQSTKDSNNVDRAMTLMCLNSHPGSNIMILTLDCHTSNEFF